ncbi:MAG: hypothetical protein SPJ44_08600, partial [Treponema sp.]|nr:hypothetical protein [Treponema sp.]
DKRYCEVMQNAYMFSSDYNSKYSIKDHQSSWFWAKRVFQISWYYKFINRDFPVVRKMSNLYKTKGIDEMARLYKYGKYEYLKDFIEYGKIRISLASVYEESENKAIQDNELKKEYIETSAGRSIITIDGKKIPCIGEGKVSYETMPYYVACFSLCNNPIMYEEFEYDCCVEILDYVEFIRKIHLASKNHPILKNWNFLPCPIHYYDKYNSSHQKERLIPEIQKDLAYTYQQELRTIWYKDNENKLCELPQYIELELGSIDYIASIHRK